jgi:uncharacterized Zn finger protein
MKLISSGKKKVINMFIIKCGECGTKQKLILKKGRDLITMRDITVIPFAGGELMITCTNCGHKIEEGKGEGETPLLFDSEGKLNSPERNGVKDAPTE